MIFFIIFVHIMTRFYINVQIKSLKDFKCGWKNLNVDIKKDKKSQLFDEIKIKASPPIYVPKKHWQIQGIARGCFLKHRCVWLTNHPYLHCKRNVHSAHFEIQEIEQTEGCLIVSKVTAICLYLPDFAWWWSSMGGEGHTYNELIYIEVYQTILKPFRNHYLVWKHQFALINLNIFMKGMQACSR